MMEKQKGIIFIGAFPNKKSPQTKETVCGDFYDISRRYG